MPAAVEGRPSGTSAWLSATSARSASSGGWSSGSKASALTAALRLMLALPRLDLEDDVGIEPDHRVAALGRAVLHAFEQEGVLAAFGELQVGADRRLEVGYDAAEDDLGAAGFVGRGKARETVPRHRITVPADRG